MARENFGEENVSTSKFYMFRCLIVMAHADGEICDEERAYISAFINRLPFTQEQEEILEKDFEEAQPIGKLLTYINDPLYRGQVVYFARIMAYKDGELHPNEEALLERLNANATDGLDMEAIKAHVTKAVAIDLNVHDIEMDKARGRPTKGGHPIPWLQWLDEVLLKLGIDILRD